MDRPARRAASAPLACLALLLAAGLAGCAGGGEGGDLAAGAGGELAAAKPMLPLSNGLAAAVEQVHWANGSVPVQDACNPVGCARGEATWQRRTDLTPALPTQAPVQLELDLTYTPHPLFGLAIQVTLLHGESVLYAHTQADEEGSSSVVASLLPRGEVVALVSVYQSTGEVPEADYALRIRIVASPDEVPPGVPVAVRLAGGDTVQVGAPGEKRGFVLLDPDGARLGSFVGAQTLDPLAPSGDYVVVLPPGAAGGVASDNGGATMRPLPLRYERGPVATVAQAGAMEESWDVTGDPLGVGLRVFNQAGATGLAPLVSFGLAARLLGPNGFELDAGTVCDGCVTLGPLGQDFVVASPLGDARVQAGTYTLHTESTVTYEAFVEGFAVYADLAG